MAQAHTTRRRSYSEINREAERARELANLRDSVDFSLNDFINGPLREYCRGRLVTRILPIDQMLEPAKVDLGKKSYSIELNVRDDIWTESREKVPFPRFVLAHEIGHIFLHKDDNFGFSSYSEHAPRFAEREYFVEDQANNFADIFLLPDGAVRNFQTPQNLIDYCDYYNCGVPEDTIKRRFGLVARSTTHHFGPKYDASRICPNCGSGRVLAVLSYHKCDDCFNISY